MSTKIYDTPRLTAIHNKISAKIIADIGTDHAYIPINAVLDGRCERAYASDIRTGPLEIARNNVVKYDLADKIALRLGAGLSAVEKGAAGEIIIAGMGGIMIRDIISNDIDKARSADRLILQPMNSAHELRRYLFENGFEIVAEDLAAEGFKIYNIFVCEKGSGGGSGDILDLHLPPMLYGHKLFDMLLDKKIKEFAKISGGIKRAANRTPEEEKNLIVYERLLEKAVSKFKADTKGTFSSGR
ncbi:MAG: SAM-dependent methyltransferase [Oscillospiraceae bacterium]|nr:SAM-dependent methyltransferase [Oscillospiraceae bacterium]